VRTRRRGRAQAARGKRSTEAQAPLPAAGQAAARTHELVAALLEAGDDLRNQAALHAVRLDLRRAARRGDPRQACCSGTRRCGCAHAAPAAPRAPPRRTMM
jgi:hypothetical protein